MRFITHLRYGFLAFGVVLGVRGELELELVCCVARSRAEDRVGMAPCTATRFLFAFGVVPAERASWASMNALTVAGRSL